jgi:murein hydrolase activator
MRRIPTSILLILLVFASPAELLAQPDYQSKSAELERLRAQIGQVQAGLEQERQRQDKLTRELRRLDRQVAEAGARVRALELEQVELASRIAALQREHVELEEKLAEHREYLAQQLLAAYVSGRQEYLRLLLNQEDPNRVDRLLVYYDYLNRARAGRIREASARIARLAEIERELAREREQLASSQQRQRREQERLVGARAERSKLLSRVEQDIRHKDQQVTRLQADEAQLLQLLQSLQQALADIPPDRELQRASFRQSKGRLSWPLEGSLGARFGSSRGPADSRSNGILIESRAGSEVRAVSYGRIVFADWLRGFGLLVIIDHGEGFMTLYGHNDSLFREAGAWVQPGEVIATVGASGGRRQPGLYFEVRSAGKPVDPLGWLRSRS